MRVFVPSPVAALVLCAIPFLSGCTLRSYSQSLGAEERRAYEFATYRDPYDAAAAAADSEIADRLVALELLRDLANRYRVADRERVLDNVEIALLEDRGSRLRVVSGQMQAPQPRSAAVQPAAIRLMDADSYAALKQSFPGNRGFGALVHRCVDTISAGADRPTYNPKLFDWLCRASILPEAGTRLGGEGDDPAMAGLALSISRLMSFAERCKMPTSFGCGGADKLIARLINQQPVAPVPQYLDKVSVERTAMPAAVTLPPPTPLTPAVTPPAAVARRPIEHYEGPNY